MAAYLSTPATQLGAMVETEPPQDSSTTLVLTAPAPEPVNPEIGWTTTTEDPW